MSVDLHTLGGAYALDAVDDLERAAFERHLQDCDACAEEVGELLATAARLGGAAALAPSPELRERVLAAAARTPQLPPRTTGQQGAPPASSSRPGRWWRSPALVAAGVLLAATVGAGAAALDQRAELLEARAQAERVSAVLAGADTTGTATAAGGGRVTVVAADGRAVVVTEGLPDLDDDLTYQLWLLDAEGAATSAGLLDPDERALPRLLEGVDDAAAVAVSVERAGGAEQPTNPIASVELA